MAAEIAVPPTGVKPAVDSVAEFATEFEPSATEFAVAADAPAPSAVPMLPVTVVLCPTATANVVNEVSAPLPSDVD